MEGEDGIGLLQKALESANYCAVCAKRASDLKHLPYQIGHEVRLLSGGPPMTVSAVDMEKLEVTCFWFDGNTPYQQIFPAQVINHHWKSIAHEIALRIKSIKQDAAEIERELFELNVEVS